MEQKEVSSTHPAHQQLLDLSAYLNTRILGQGNLVSRLLIALLADGHLLVEGAPGLAKTRAVKELSAGVEGRFHRIQFTPDLLPGDLTGTDVYHPEDGSFVFQPGPIFHNMVLADEINRAPAKVQSALLEAMGERQVTIGSTTYPLPELFLVMATQNPIEQEGTYPLPEAQLDRFLFKNSIDYPKLDEEITILQREHILQNNGKLENIKTVLSSAEIKSYQALVKQIIVEQNLLEYIAKIVLFAWRKQDHSLVDSPRLMKGVARVRIPLLSFP